MKAMEMILEQTEAVAVKAGLPPVKHIEVYEEVKALSGYMIRIPVKKVKSLRALGLLADEETK